MTISEKSDDELMEQIQMLMAQAAESAKLLRKRKISFSIMIYDDASFDARFWCSEEITPGKKNK